MTDPNPDQAQHTHTKEKQKRSEPKTIFFFSGSSCPFRAVRSFFRILYSPLRTARSSVSDSWVPLKRFAPFSRVFESLSKGSLVLLLLLRFSSPFQTVRVFWSACKGFCLACGQHRKPRQPDKPPPAGGSGDPGCENAKNTRTVRPSVSVSLIPSNGSLPWLKFSNPFRTVNSFASLLFLKSTAPFRTVRSSFYDSLMPFKRFVVLSLKISSLLFL